MPPIECPTSTTGPRGDHHLQHGFQVLAELLDGVRLGRRPRRTGRGPVGRRTPSGPGRPTPLPGGPAESGRRPCTDRTRARTRPSAARRDGPTSRTANGTPSGVVTTLARSASRSVEVLRRMRVVDGILLRHRARDGHTCQGADRGEPGDARQQACILEAPAPRLLATGQPGQLRGVLRRAGEAIVDTLRALIADALSLNGSALTVDAGDPAARAGDHLVVDGVEQVRPVLRGGFAVAAGAEQDGRRRPRATSVCAGSEIDDELVHADAADAGPPTAVDQHVDAAAQSPGTHRRRSRSASAPAWCRDRRPRCARRTRRRPHAPI